MRWRHKASVFWLLENFECIYLMKQTSGRPLEDIYTRTDEFDGLRYFPPPPASIQDDVEEVVPETVTPEKGKHGSKQKKDQTQMRIADMRVSTVCGWLPMVIRYWQGVLTVLPAAVLAFQMIHFLK